MTTVNCGGWFANRGVLIILPKLEELGISPKEQEGVSNSNNITDWLLRTTSRSVIPATKPILVSDSKILRSFLDTKLR